MISFISQIVIRYHCWAQVNLFDCVEDIFRCVIYLDKCKFKMCDLTINKLLSLLKSNCIK